MNAPLERIARAYRPLYPRGTIIESGWMHHQLQATRSAPPKRLTLLAWVAVVAARPGRRSA